jgi:site-specific DNA recombinase
MTDIEKGRVNCVVVYKIDRLSRSLADFTRLMDVFERYNATFISVTQSFSTTTSMGRLTLNILLSFAQFERENSADRIRDKVAASRRKGMWMGGIPPLGYDVLNRELVINNEEAEQVRYIFRRFKECGSPTRVVKDLQSAGITNKSWTTQKGVRREGKPFHKASLHRTLKNRVYLGEVVFKGEIYPGKHKGIIPQGLWDKVHSVISGNRHDRSTLPRGQTPFPLKGLVRCGHCDMSMKPTHTRKKGQVQYRYYLCLNAARTSHDQCPVPSVPAAELERLVLDRIRGILKSPDVVAGAIRHVRSEDNECSESEVIDLLMRLDPVWEELFPLEQNRLLKLLVENVSVTNHGVDIRLPLLGMESLIDELIAEERKTA